MRSAGVSRCEHHVCEHRRRRPDKSDGGRSENQPIRSEAAGLEVCFGIGSQAIGGFDCCLCLPRAAGIVRVRAG